MSKKFQTALIAYTEAKAALDDAKAALALAENRLLEHLRCRRVSPVRSTLGRSN